MEKEQEYLKQQILELFPQYGINTNIGNYLAKIDLEECAEAIVKKMSVMRSCGSEAEQLCEHPLEKRASGKSLGKGFCWKCGEHIEA
tara:strand:+ start:570 stop:830 length:261 start_codon:yes stop_codon:yes gene_type:complete